MYPDHGPVRLLDVRGLNVVYPETDELVIRDLSVDLEAGELMVLSGPSGCGKSTLMHCIRGAIPGLFDARVSGQILVDGQDIASQSVTSLAQKVGLVLQEPSAQLCNLTVETEVAFGVENLQLPREVCRQRIADALASVSLTHKARESVDALSGGECQRLAIASVLAMAPQLILLDEPTATLDSASAAEIVSLIRRLKADGHGLLVVQHDFEELLPYADRFVVMDQGRIVFQGSPRSVVAGLLKSRPRPIAVPSVSDLADRVGIAVDEERCPLTPEEFVSAIGPARSNGHVESEPTPVVSGSGHEYLSAVDLTFRYSRRSKPAVDGVSLRLGRGETVALVGPNGSGKSTLARLLVGLLEPESGSATIAGKGIERLRHTASARDTGYVFQFPEHQFVADSVRDEIGYGLVCRGMADDLVDAAVVDIADRLNLGARLERHPFSLSGGEKRRLSVATMLVLRPQILVLDEPTYGLDEANLSSLVELIFSELRAIDATVIVITHDLALVASHANRVVAMAGGRAVFVGTPAELFQEGRLDELGLCPPPIARVRRLATQRGWRMSPGGVSVGELAAQIVSIREADQSGAV